MARPSPLPLIVLTLTLLVCIVYWTASPQPVTVAPRQKKEGIAGLNEARAVQTQVVSGARRREKEGAAGPQEVLNQTQEVSGAPRQEKEGSAGLKEVRAVLNQTQVSGAPRQEKEGAAGPQEVLDRPQTTLVPQTPRPTLVPQTPRPLPDPIPDAFEAAVQLGTELTPTYLPTVVTVFDGPFAAAFANFVAMCKSAGLPNVVGLALSQEALEIAQGDVKKTGVDQGADVTVFRSSWVERYLNSDVCRGMSRWFCIGRAKLWVTLAGILADIPTFVVEMDVILLKPIFRTFPDAKTFDVLSMYCENTDPYNRFNLGFQLFHPTLTTKRFFKKVVQLAFRGGDWDQGVFNAIYLANKRLIRTVCLEICEPNGKWGNEVAIHPFVELVRRGGSSHSAAASPKVPIGIHIIGNHGMGKLEWMQQAQVLDSKPYGATSFIMLGGIVDDVDYGRAVRSLFDAARLLNRTVILPHMRSGNSPHPTVNVEQLRRENRVGLRYPAFLNGQFYLDRSPRPALAFQCDEQLLETLSDQSSNNSNIPAGVLILSQSFGNLTACESPHPINDTYRAALSTGRGLPNWWMPPTPQPPTPEPAPETEAPDDEDIAKVRIQMGELASKAEEQSSDKTQHHQAEIEQMSEDLATHLSSTT